MIAVHFVPMLKGTVAPKSKVFSVVLFIHLVCTVLSSMEWDMAPHM